jgi:hypothetical protein
MGSSPAELFATADSLGYRFSRLNDDGTPGPALGAGDLERVEIENLLLTTA